MTMMQSPNTCTTHCRCILDVSTCISQSINERQKQKQEHLYSRRFVPMPGAGFQIQ